MAASLRESFNSLGWSRRDEPANTSSQSGLLSSISNLNPFQDRGYLRLPTSENAGAPLPAPTRREEEEGWFVRESFLAPCSPRGVSYRLPPASGRCIASPPCLDDACDADVALRGVANTGNSEQMGSFDGIWGLQPCRPSLLRHMLFLVPGTLIAADQVCHSVCCKETWGVPLFHSLFLSSPPPFPLLPCDAAV
jgi:hypothetical protein